METGRRLPKIFIALTSISKGRRKTCSLEGQKEASLKVDYRAPQCIGTLTSPMSASCFGEDPCAPAASALMPYRPRASKVSTLRIRLGLVLLALMSLTGTCKDVDFKRVDSKEIGSAEGLGEVTKRPTWRASCEKEPNLPKDFLHPTSPSAHVLPYSKSLAPALQDQLARKRNGMH
ncbi:hypothetical protein ACLOJK_014584 [Asimina triloba]